MQVGGLQQLLADDLTCAALEKHIIRYYNSRSASGFQNGIDVLDEIQLLVGAGGPEVLTVIDKLLVLILALLIGDGNGRLFAEGWIGEHIVHTIAGICQQGVANGNGHFTINIADVVQIQVHQCHLEGIAHQLIAIEGFIFQELLILAGESVISRIGEEFLRR